MAILGDAVVAEFEIESYHAFGSLLAIGVNVDAPSIGDDVAEDMVLLVVLDFSLSMRLGGVDFVFSDEEGEGELFGDGLCESQTNDGIVFVTIGSAGDEHIDLGVLVDDSIDAVVQTAGGGEEVGSVAIDHGSGKAGGADEFVEPDIALLSAEVGVFAKGAAEIVVGVDGGNNQCIAVFVGGGVDGLIGIGAVDAADAGVFLNKGSLGVGNVGFAIIPSAVGTGKDDKFAILFFNFVACGKHQCHSCKE